MTNTGFYSKKVIDYFHNPRNYGSLSNPSAKGEAGNIICGDLMSLEIKIKKETETISDIKFKTFGCAAAIATSSAVTDLAKGKTITEALNLSKKDIVDFLEGLPPIKIHCSLLAIDALQEAIYQYLLKNKKPIPKKLSEIHLRVEKGKKHIDKHHHH